MQVPTIDDCRLLMSWVSSPVDTQLHTAARRVCLAVHHWTPEPTAAYAAALVEANQQALQQATDDPLGSEAYIGWIWEAADWLAVTLNRARVQWMHHKAQHALLRPVLEFQAGKECALMRQLLETDEKDCFTGYMALVATDLAADLAGFLQNGIPMVDALLMENKHVAAVNVLVSVLLFEGQSLH